MEYVFSTDPPIVVVEIEDDEADLSTYHVYAEGENVGTAYNIHEAKAIAREVFAALTGAEEEEEPL